MTRRIFSAVAFMLTSSCGSSNNSPVSPSTPTIFSLSGQVSDSTTGTGIAGATVAIADGANAGRSATTEGSGAYGMTGLQSSGFTVNVSANGYVASSRGVTLSANATLSFPLTRVPVVPAAVTVTGTVTDGTSHGVLPNIAVQISDGVNAGKSARTDAAGNYDIGGVVPGTFAMSAAAVSYETITTQVTVSANARVDFVLQRVAPSCSFTVTPLHLGFTLGGFPTTSGIVSLAASAPACAWTATNDPADWLSLQVRGSSAPYSHAVSGTGSADLLTGANPDIFGGQRLSVVKVRWPGGGIDLIACQPDC